MSILDGWEWARKGTQQVLVGPGPDGHIVLALQAANVYRAWIEFFEAEGRAPTVPELEKGSGARRTTTYSILDQLAGYGLLVDDATPDRSFLSLHRLRPWVAS